VRERERERESERERERERERDCSDMCAPRDTRLTHFTTLLLYTHDLTTHSLYYYVTTVRHGITRHGIQQPMSKDVKRLYSLYYITTVHARIRLHIHFITSPHIHFVTSPFTTLLLYTHNLTTHPLYYVTTVHIGSRETVLSSRHPKTSRGSSHFTERPTHCRVPTATRRKRKSRRRRSRRRRRRTRRRWR